MAIETLEDWNQVLACCCEMPECPVPTKECESLTANAGCPAAPDPPEEPGENESISYGCFLPLQVSAEMDDEAELEVYKKLSDVTEINWAEGIYANFTSDEPGGPGTGVRELATNQNFTTKEWTTSDWFQEGDSPWALVGPDSTSGVIDFPPSVGGWVTGNAESCELTPTTRIYKSESELSESGDPGSIRTTTSLTDGTPPTPIGNSEAWDLERGDEKINWTLSAALSKATLIDAALADFPEFPEVPTGANCVASCDLTWPKKGDYEWPECATSTVRNASVSASLVKVRFRWIIPDTFEGSYFKITWDVLEEPDGWDNEINDPDYEPPVPNDPPEPIPQVPDPDAPHRSYFLTDQTWEWTGPGDPEDADSWKSGWYAVDPPTTPGEKRVVNIRFECYRSTKFGTRPQVTGEAVELPDP